MHYVIRKKDEPHLYWKSGLGWTAYSNCSSFDYRHRTRLPLPPEGEWYEVVPIVDPSEQEQPA